jgi:hypothetical protein
MLSSAALPVKVTVTTVTFHKSVYPVCVARSALHKKAPEPGFDTAQEYGSAFKAVLVSAYVGLDAP